MKKMSFFLVIALLVLSILPGCSQNSQESTPEPEIVADSQSEPSDDAQDAEGELVDPAAPPAESDEEPQPPASGDNVLVMATEAGFSPYEYYEGTDIVGVDVDIAKEIAAYMGKELVVEHMPFDSIIPAVNSGKAAFGAAGMSITEERLQKVDFSIEYATSKQVILTKADSDITEEAHLDGKTVGVQLGTVADIVLSDDYPDVTVAQYTKYFEAANDLISGRIDAIVLDVLPAQELAKMDESLAIREKELFTDVYAFCVKKDGDPELLDAINTVMQRLIDEGKIDEFTAAHLADE